MILVSVGLVRDFLVHWRKTRSGRESTAQGMDLCAWLPLPRKIILVAISIRIGVISTGIFKAFLVF